MSWRRGWEKEPSAKPLAAPSGWRAKEGPRFEINAPGAGPVDLHTEHALACQRLEAMGFERVASNEAYHSGRDEQGDQKDEFILWAHPRGMLLLTDSYHGLFSRSGGVESYDKSIKRFNSFHLYWQTRVGGGEGSGARSLGGSSSMDAEGDGCRRLIQGETYTQPGSDMRALLGRLNEQALAPLEEWLDSFVYLNPGLYLNNKRLAEEGPDGKSEEKRARAAFIAGLPEPVRGAFRGARSEAKRERRPDGSFNDLASLCMQAAGMLLQEPGDSERLKALSLGRAPEGAEGWEPMGLCQLGASHALPYFKDEGGEWERALAAWEALDDETALRLANAPDSRGVTPFMNCFALSRGVSQEAGEHALELIERMSARFGARLAASTPSKRVSALSLMLCDAPPGLEFAGSMFKEKEGEFMERAMRACLGHGVELWRFSPLSDPKEAEACGSKWRLEAPAERGEERSDSAAAQAFLEEARARLGEHSAAPGILAEVRILREGMSKPAAKAPRAGL